MLVIDFRNDISARSTSQRMSSVSARPRFPFWLNMNSRTRPDDDKRKRLPKRWAKPRGKECTLGWHDPMGLPSKASLARVILWGEHQLPLVQVGLLQGALVTLHRP